MLKKPCKPSNELQCLRSLKKRMIFSVKEEQHYNNLEKGLEGEKLFNQLLSQLSQDSIIINDLLVEHHHSFFQIDTLVITHEGVHLFEVKHFEGRYYLHDNRFHQMNGREIKDPLLQLRRSESFLRQLFQDLHLPLPIKASLVFIHPSFTLYHASFELPIILPTEGSHWIKKWNQQPFTPLPHHYHQYADQLSALHCEVSPYTRLPNYDLSSLRKEIYCPDCFKPMIENKNKIACSSCGKIENRWEGILRSTEEFRLLFPKEKITTSIIQDWCGLQGNKKNVTRALHSYYQRIGRGKGSYFVPAY